MEENKYNINLGKLILKMRRRLKITHYKVWKDINMPSHIIKRLESGKGTLANFQKLLGYLILEREKVEPTLFHDLITDIDNWMETYFSGVDLEEEEEEEQTN